VDDWIRSSLEAVRVARSHWTRMEANMGLSAYEISTSAALLDQPVWPKESLEELLQLAFRDKVITAPDHPALRRLRGEI
jgi:hypothetical protein